MLGEMTLHSRILEVNAWRRRRSKAFTTGHMGARGGVESLQPQTARSFFAEGAEGTGNVVDAGATFLLAKLLCMYEC